MQKLFFLMIFFSACLNVTAFDQEVKEKKSSEKNLFDSTKIKSLQIPDTTKKFSGDSVKTILREKLIPIIPNNSYLVTEKENTYDNNTLQKLDVRYTGNYFSYIPFGFLRDFGSIGQPNEVIIYGNGFGSSSFLINGLNVNNRLTNSLDLNLFQSESIDTIEIIPLAQGFLYNEMNNPVTVNFVTKNFVVTKPYTRIRFYQAPNEEGFFDGIFSSNISRRLNIFSEITHQSTDPRFKNSDYGMWAGSVRLRYLISNEFNVIGSYSYYQSNVQLNGGVDVDSIKRILSSPPVEEILFSTIQAPVNYLDRYQKVSTHNLNVRLLANLIGDKPTDLTFYYASSLNEFRQNEHTKNSVQDIWRWDWPWRHDTITNNNEFNTYGTKLSQSFETDFLDIYSEALFESTLLNTPLIKRDDHINTFSAMAKVSFRLQRGEQKFIPSVFSKFLNYDGNNYFGAGADVSCNINENYSMYLGLSKFKRPPNNFANQSGLNYKSDQSIIEAKLIYKSTKATISTGYFFQDLAIDESFYKTLQGINLKLDWHLWKLLLSTNTNYYFIQDKKENFPLPDFTSNGGIYYIDTLFNANLKLKAGINYYLIGNRGYQFVNFETFEITSWVRTNASIIPPSADVKPSVQFDFFLAGKIQDAATVYFVFENLLNERYYVVPYYPKQERGIRLGVSWEFTD